jgi:hypothetical protein
VSSSLAMRAWSCVLGIVNVFVEGTVETGTECQCFDRNGVRVELISVAKVNEGMRDCWSISNVCKSALSAYVLRSNH